MYSLSYFLLACCFKIVWSGSTCSGTENLAPDFIQCTFLNVALQENGGKSSAVVGVDEIPCPRLNDGDVEDVSDGDVNSNSVVKIEFARPYLIDTVRITESGNAAESDEISIHFSDGSTQWIKMSPGSSAPEEFSFVPRVASWIKLTVSSKYADGADRFTEIEVYNGACVDENVCDFVKCTDEQLTSMPYIHGNVFSFLRKGSDQMDLRLSDSNGAHKYNLPFTDKVKISSAGKAVAGPNTIPGVELAAHWIPFWLDLRKTGRIVIGTGSTTLINFTATDGGVLTPFLKFHGRNAGDQVIYCDKKDSCLDDADHFWPLDKVANNRVYDSKTKMFSQVSGSVTMNLVGPPLEFGNRTSILLSDGFVDLFSPTSSLYSQEFSTKGFSVALWLKIESLSAKTDYYLSGGKASQGFSIYSPVEGDRIDTNNVLEIVFQEKNQWRVSVSFSLQTWHWIACSWHPSDGLLCLIDLGTVLKGTLGAPRSTFSSLTLGKAAAIPNTNGHASVSSLAIWERKLTSSEFQSLYHCMKINPRYEGNIDLGVGSFRLPDESFSASSYTEDGQPHFVRFSSGGWISSVSDENQYLQVDFLTIMEIKTLHMEGNPDLNAFVEKFMLAQSEDGISWTTLKNTLGNDKIMVANSDSTTLKPLSIGVMVTRWMRFIPVKFQNRIALKLEIKGTKKYSHTLGCLSKSSVTSPLYHLVSASDPFVCMVGCGQMAFPYAMLANGGECFCASKLDITNDASEDVCKVPCKEKKMLSCGGRGHFAVYSVSAFGNGTFQLSAPTWTNENTPVTFAFTVDNKTTTEVYRKHSAVSTTLSYVELTFENSGIEVVILKARTSGLLSKNFHMEHSILVTTKAKSLTFECPSLVVANKGYECVLSGFTGPLDVFNYTVNGAVKETALLPMGFSGTVGGLHYKISNAAQAKVGLYFVSSFFELASISSIEIHVEQIGKLSVVVLRPVCGSGMFREYCDVNNQCTNFHPTCDLSGYKCSDDKMLHLPSGQCFESGSYECLGTATTSRFIPRKYHKYEIIFIKEVNVPEVGHHQILSKGETVDVREDDVIGVYYPSVGAAILTVESYNAYEGLFEVTDSANLVKGGFIEAPAESVKLVHMQHSLKARYFVPQRQVFPVSFPPGIYHNAVSLQNNINQFEFSHKIISADPIEGVSWTLDAIVATNDVYTITASATAGTNITFVVRYDDGAEETFFQKNVSDPVSFSHAYTSPGYKFIKLTTWNHISYEVSNHMLLVQDYIKDVNLTSPVKPARLTHITAIDWYVDSGSRVTIEIDLGDGTTFLDEHLDIQGIRERPIRHVYANPIEYWVNITAYNLVNRIELYFMIIVEIPIVELTSRVIHANRDIEVNETVEIELTQLNGTNVIHYFEFQDRSTLLTRETSILKNYSYWQVFPVNITAWNNVSWVSWTQPIKVHKPIIELTGFVIATSPTNHTDAVKLDFDMSTGSDFDCTWNFDDGLFGHSSYWITDEQVYKWPITHQEMFHKYAGIGVYHVRINCTNRLYSTTASTISIVQVPISGLELDQPPPQPNDEDLVVNFRAATGTNISYTVTFYHIWDKREIEITDVEISPDTLEGTAVIDKQHFTDRVALYDVKITAVNLVTPLQTLIKTVIVDRPIREEEITVHADYVETNHTVNYTINADASNVTITWDFNDPNAGDLNIKTKWFQGVFDTDGWTVWHKFDHSGFYFIDITLTNSLGTVHVRERVKGEFGVYLSTVTDSPRPLPPGRLNFTFFPIPERYFWHPTDAQMIMQFGDGKNYTGPYNSTVIHFYESWGMFQVNCTIMNKISWGFFTFDVEIQRIIQGLKLTPFHSDGDAGYFGPARGVGRDRLPLEYDVIWNVTTTDGTNITYTYDFGDGQFEITQNATVFHKYDEVGFYKGTVWAENAVSKGFTTYTIRIQKIVVGVDIDSNCPRKLGHPTTFRVTIDQVGTESCYLIKFGNNSENWLYKDHADTICEQNFLDLADRTEVFDGANSFELNYTYGFIDVYWPRLIGSNLVSKTWKFHKAVVLWNHCDYPKVDVFNVGKNSTTATSVMRSQVFMVDTQNIVKCEASKTTSFLWEVFIVNPDEAGNDTIYTFSSSVVVNNPRFRIDPRLLPYGLYRMRFTITMLGIDGVLGFDDGFVQIVQSPLITTINGGTGLGKGYKQNVTLDASGSQDPDVGPGQYENITMSWECVAENVPSGTTALQAGCSVDDFELLKNGSASDLVYLSTNFTLLPNINYALRLTIVKSHRRMRMYFNLHTMEHDSLPVFVKCLQNCKKKRISAVKLAYKGGIRGLTDPEVLKRVEYRWNLYEAPERGRIHRIEEDQWKPVEDFVEEMVLTSTTTDTVVIGEKMLLPTSRYRLRLYVTLDDKTGFAEDELFINQPPGGGECQIDPAEGYALDTEFRVSCSGWTDEDLPLSYKFAYKTSEEDFEQLIYFGSKSETPPVKLPLGKPHLNYSVSVIVDTADSFLAPHVAVLNVTVTAKPITSLAEFEAQMIQMISQDGPLGNMMASGDAHSATQLVGALSSLLDSLAGNTSSPVQDEIDALESLDTELMKPEEIEAIEKKKYDLREADRIRMQNETLIRVKMRKMMEETVASIPIDSVEAIREKATASASLSNTPGEVTEEMQDSAMNAADEMIMFLGNSTMSDEPPNPQDTFNAAGGLMNTLGNAMEASIETGSRVNKTDDGSDGNTTKVDSASRGLVTKAMQNVENLASAVLTQKFAGEPATEVKTGRLSMAVQRADPSSSGKIGASTGGGDFMMPNVGSLFGIEGNDTSGIPPVDTKAVSNSKNPFAWDSSSSKVKSKVMTMELKNASGHPIKVSNLSKPIDMWVPRGLSVNFSLYTVNHGKLLYRAFPVVENDTSIQVEILAEDNNTELIAYLRRGKFPTEEIYDFKYVLPKREFLVEPTGNVSSTNKTKTGRQINPYIVFRSNEDMNRTAAGKYYIGVKYNGTYEPMYEAIMSGGKVVYQEYIPPSINFTMRTFTSSCLYWSIENDTWKSDGCVVGPKTAMEGTQCLCTHLTSFGGDMVVAPNTIDWSAISLDNLFSNPIVFAVVMSFIFLYFILLIPARRQDKKDLEKLGVVPLPDNDPRDNYSYEITVYTGFSAEAGTTADVYFILKGTYDETPVRILKDPNKNRMSVGSINYFLLTVPSSLGKLKSIRIWHDNGGSSPSWYLLRLMVHDIQRDTKTWFLCDRWLAVEEDDGEIERVLRPADAEDLTKFNLLFQTEARKNLSDGHIWFSVVKRPARSNFTRVQRLSCCLCILLTTMLANAMFYQNDPSSSGDGVLKVGPLSFSIQQVSIAITSSLVVLPVNLFVVWIFRNARPKKTAKEKRKEEEAKHQAKRKAQKNANSKTKKDKDKKDKEPKKKSSLPHWMIYVAYFCIFIACAVSATFTVFYGLTFGKAKSEAWISAMMISFWQDVLISQPLKVFAAATLFALLTKDPKKATGEEEEGNLPSPELQEDEEFTEAHLEGRGLVSMTRIDPKPPDQQKLQASRELKLKQKKMKYIIYDIVWYFIFVTVLLSVAHGNKDEVAYGTTATMSNYFETSSYTNWIDLDEVTDAKLYWYWSRYSLLPTIIPNQWYGPNLIMENVVWVKSDPQISQSRGARSRLNLNKNKIRKIQGRPGQFPDMTIVLNNTHPYPEGYVADSATDYTVGVARFRQLRVKPDQCTIHPTFRHMFDECNSFYSWEKEDEGRYKAGWIENHEKKNVNDTATEKQKNAWEYNTAWELKGTPYWAGFSTYWGGGFVADLGHNESLAMNMTAYLQENGWLDRYTRAIFLEFTTYNPNVNMFCLVTLVSEIIPTGAYYQFNKIYPLRLYRYFGPNLMAIMVLEIVLMTFLLYFAYREFKKWRREGRLYWKDPWTYMELLVLASCFSTIGLYFARMVATNYSIGLMQDDPESFVSFHYAAALDQWSTFTLGMAVFLSFLKTLRLLRFNRRMSFMSKTLKICIKPLASFFLVYTVVFLAYASFGFLVFGKIATDYHTFQGSMANVLGMSLGAFNFHALVEGHRVLGPLFFFTFTFVVNFILINVFVAIISEALKIVTSDAANQSNDHEILDFMVHQFKSYIGHRVAPAIKPVYVEPLSGVEDSIDKIQKKTEGVETAFRNLCMEEIRHTSWFDPDRCTDKKKLLIRLLLHVDNQITETEICDAIPLLDEVIRAYTEKDFKDWLTQFGEEFDDDRSMRSSILFSRATLYDSDDSSSSDNSDDSLPEGRWSQLSGDSTVVSVDTNNLFPGTSEIPDAREGSVQGYYQKYNERPPSTAEIFCRAPSAASMTSMTSLNENLAFVDQLLQKGDCHQRLFMEVEEDRNSEPEEEVELSEVEEELEKMETESQADESERVPSWKMNIDEPTPTQVGSGSSMEVRKETPRNDSPLFQTSFSPRSKKNNEHNITVEDLSD